MGRCKEILANGGNIMVFPEGERSRDGSMNPFKDGFFMLAAEVGCPILYVEIFQMFCFRKFDLLARICGYLWFEKCLSKNLMF